MPIPPTTKEIAAIPVKATVKVPIMELMEFNNWAESKTEKASSSYFFNRRVFICSLVVSILVLSGALTGYFDYH